MMVTTGMPVCCYCWLLQPAAGLPACWLTSMLVSCKHTTAKKLHITLHRTGNVLSVGHATRYMEITKTAAE